jgi:hypothetical protein
VLEIDEIQEISQVFISMLSKEDLPIANNLGFGKNGNKYDELIGLWTKYWNDVFAPSEKLDPSLVKALMATESGFQEVPADAPRGHKAIGIMQLMPETVKYLSSSKELKDFHFDLTQREAWDPAVNIASSVRWLFRKREVGEARLKKKLSWIEVIEEYKGITGDNSKEAFFIRKSFSRYLTSLKEGK